MKKVVNIWTGEESIKLAFFSEWGHAPTAQRKIPIDDLPEVVAVWYDLSEKEKIRADYYDNEQRRVAALLWPALLDRMIANVHLLTGYEHYPGSQEAHQEPGQLE